MSRYDFLSPSSLPPDVVFVVHRGVAWMIVGRNLAVEWAITHSAALARADKIAEERSWRVEDVTHSES